MNPGLFTGEQQGLFEALRSLSKVHYGQDKVLEALKEIKANPEAADDKLTELVARLAAFERDVGGLKELVAELQQLKAANSSLAEQLDRAVRRKDELENRSHRHNLAFYKLKETVGESGRL
ncbi:hypothetical protein MRX96_048238 [Rhipicephalus microplus]